MDSATAFAEHFGGTAEPARTAIGYAIASIRHITTAFAFTAELAQVSSAGS